MKVRFKSKVTGDFSFSPLRDSCSPLRDSLIGKKKKNLWDQGSQNFVALNKSMSAMTSQHGGGDSFYGRKDVQNGGRSILKMTTAFGLFSSLSKGKIYFFLLFTSNISYLNSFKLPYKIRLLAFRSPLNELNCSCLRQIIKRLINRA